MSDTTYIWPVAGQTRQQARITNAFGAQQVRSAGWKGNLPPTNNGVDIAAAAGTGLVAPASGTVVEVRRSATDNSGWGNSVVIEDAQGRRHRLSHLMDEPAVKVGDTVRAGQQVGRVGQTGNATGPHLDYEVRVNGQPTDALSLVFGTGAAPITAAPKAGAQPMAETGGKSQLLTTLEARRDRIQQELEQKRGILERLQGTQMGPPGLDEDLLFPEDVRKEVAQLQKELDAAEEELARESAKPAAAAERPTAVSTNTTEPYIVSRKPDGTLQQEPNPNYRQPTETAQAQRPQTFQGADGMQYILSPDGKSATLVTGQGQPVSTAQQTTFQVVTNPADGSMWAYNPRTGQVATQLFAGKSEEELAAAKLEATTRAEILKLGQNIRQELSAALELPAGPERDQAIETVTRKYAMLEGPAGARALLQMGQQEADRKQRAAAQLAAQTGIQYDPETMQPVVDPLTGAFMKTVEQVERERVAEVQRVQAQRSLEANAISQQNADETGRHNIESELTSRGTQRSTALRDIASAAGLGTGREVWTPATAAARVASQSQVLDRNGIANVGRSLGLDENMLNSVLSGYDSFQEQQQQLRSQIQPVRRAPDVGAAPAAPPVGTGPISPAPTPSLPPPSPITVSPLDAEPPIAAAAALAPPPPLGEPETVMIPRAAPARSPGVPSTLDELLRQLNLLPTGWAY